MKNIIQLIILICLSSSMFAQAPSSFNYQGVARDAQGQIINSQAISLRLSILENSSSGTSVFSEEHQVTTSSLGVFSLQIGHGANIIGTMSSIAWGAKTHWLKVELDATGGSNYILMGTSQLVSVPYAMHAETVTNADDADADVTNELQAISKSGNNITLSQNGGSVSIEDADANPSNELQTLGFNVATNMLTLTDGGQVDLSTLDNDGGGTNSGTDDQHLSLSGTNLSIEDGNTVDLSLVQDGVNDADADASNELQTITKSGNTVSLSNNGGTFVDAVDDADADPNNEIQHLNLAGTTLEITGGNNVDLSSLGGGGTSPWKTIGLDSIRYKADHATVIIENDIDQNTTEITGDYININTGFDSRTSLQEHNLAFYKEYEISPNVIGLDILTDLTTDSLVFPSYVDAGVATGSSSYGRDLLNLKSFIGPQLDNACLSPSNLCLNQKIGSDPSSDMNLDAENINFSRQGLGTNIITQIGLDSLYMTSQIGLLLPVSTTLKPWELTFWDLDYQSHVSRMGFDVKQSISSSDIFNRISLYPDDFTMYNGAKWKTISATTNTSNLHGEFRIFGDGNIPHTSFTSGIDGPIFEMNNGSDLRVGAWGFEDFGLINTMGRNGFQNTFIGATETNNNLGAIGVMDELGIPRAGMEAGTFGEGTVYTHGSMNVLKENGTDQSVSDHQGYRYIGANGGDIALIGPSIYDTNTGVVYTIGSDETLNFFAGGNEVAYGGGSLQHGFAAVYSGGMPEPRAGMYVDGNEDGNLFSNKIQINNPPNLDYPFSMVQESLKGLNLIRDDFAVNWELFISSSDQLQLYKNDIYLGGFNPTTGAYTSISDRRLKSNIREMNPILTKINQLIPSRYLYRNNNPTNRASLGFIAQDVKKVFPELVDESTDPKSEGILTLDYAGFGVIAIKAIQEQQEIIDRQATEIDNLKSRLEKIEKMLMKK